VIEELENDLSATVIRTNNFWAIDALFITGLIARNLLNCIRRIVLPRPYRTSGANGFRFCFSRSAPTRSAVYAGCG